MYNIIARLFIGVMLVALGGNAVEAQEMSAKGIAGHANVARQDAQINVLQNRMDGFQSVLEGITDSTCEVGDFVTGITVDGQVECDTAPVGGIIPTSCAPGEFIAEIAPNGSVRCEAGTGTGGDGSDGGDGGDGKDLKFACPCGACGSTKTKSGWRQGRNLCTQIRLCTLSGWVLVEDECTYMAPGGL